ncbi:L,D-transpeptidase [soil metagenome]
MSKLPTILLLTLGLGLTINSHAAGVRYGQTLCSDPAYRCMVTRNGDTWAGLWRNDREREVMMRLNRMNVELQPGTVIAVPKNLRQMSVMDISPFSYKIRPRGQKLLLVHLGELAWGAYDKEGNLINWGPASGGRGWCTDVNQRCNTPTGKFSIVSKGTESCVSKKYPIGDGPRAPMPQCMFFHGGYALHGSYNVPGYAASHGCVRMYPSDARWLNHQFTTIGTRVVIVNPST